MTAHADALYLPPQIAISAHRRAAPSAVTGLRRRPTSWPRPRRMLCLRMHCRYDSCTRSLRQVRASLCHHSLSHDIDDIDDDGRRGCSGVHGNCHHDHGDGDDGDGDGHHDCCYADAAFPGGCGSLRPGYPLCIPGTRKRMMPA